MMTVVRPRPPVADFPLSTNVVFNHSDGKSHFYKFKDEARTASISTMLSLRPAIPHCLVCRVISPQSPLRPNNNISSQSLAVLAGLVDVTDLAIHHSGQLRHQRVRSHKPSGKAEQPDVDHRAPRHWRWRELFLLGDWSRGLKFIGEDTRNCSSSNYAARKQGAY